MGYLMDCPNCLTPWKCNGPHLEKMSDIHYLSNDGYYLFQDKWVFIPFEKEFNEDALISVTDTLSFLNSKKTISS